MARTCTICSHPERAAIDGALVGGGGIPAIAAKYRVSEDALGRHKSGHVPAVLAKAAEAEEVSRADDLLAQLRSLQKRTLGLLDKAEGSGRLGTAVIAIREARGNLELLAEMTDQLDRRPVVNLWLAPEWLAVRTALLSVLLGYPEARAAVASKLVELEAVDGPRS